MPGCSHWSTCSTVPGVYSLPMLSILAIRHCPSSSHLSSDMLCVSFCCSRGRTGQRIRGSLHRCGGILLQGVLLSPSDDLTVKFVPFYTTNRMNRFKIPPKDNYRPHSTAKKADNVIGSVRLSVCPSALSRINRWFLGWRSSRYWESPCWLQQKVTTPWQMMTTTTIMRLISQFLFEISGVDNL